MATVGLLVVLAGSAAIMSSAQSEASDVRYGPLETATGLSGSRVAAFDAKATESLTLIARGSATELDEDWANAFKEAVGELDASTYPAAREALENYGAEHQEVNATDLSGDWEGALEAALADEEGSGNALFASYADQTQKALESQAETTSDRLSVVGDPLLPTGIALLVVGLLCAAGAWWGISLRLDEYR